MVQPVRRAISRRRAVSPRTVRLATLPRLSTPALARWAAPNPFTVLLSRPIQMIACRNSGHKISQPVALQAYTEQALHKPEDRIDAFLELHIEQGPILEEKEKVNISPHQAACALLWTVWSLSACKRSMCTFLAVKKSKWSLTPAWAADGAMSRLRRGS